MPLLTRDEEEYGLFVGVFHTENTDLLREFYHSRAESQPLAPPLCNARAPRETNAHRRRGGVRTPPRGAGLVERLRRVWRTTDATRIVFRTIHLSNLFRIWPELIQQFIQSWRQDLGQIQIGKCS